MSYMSMTIYNIYSFFIYYSLFCLHHNLFAYIVCLRAREITYKRTFTNIDVITRVSMKLIMVWFVHVLYTVKDNMLHIMSDSHFQYTSNQNR